MAKCSKHSTYYIISTVVTTLNILEKDIINTSNLYAFKWLGWLLISTCFWQVLGFGDYIEEVYAAYEQHKLETMVIV